MTEPDDPITNGVVTCPYCGRDLETPLELENDLCSSDDCVRFDGELA